MKVGIATVILGAFGSLVFAQAPNRAAIEGSGEDENSVVVRGTRYTKLECVGRGGSSKVACTGTMCQLMKIATFELLAWW